MAAQKLQSQSGDRELIGLLSQNEELQRYLFQAFTPVALTFLLVYAVLQARAGVLGLAALYAGTAGIIAANWWAIRFHNRLVIAANVFAALGPVVLLPWQVSGGLANTGLMWFPAYVVFAMFFVPGRGGSFWVICTYAVSFFLLLLQLQGVVPLPYPEDVMLHFYFVGGITFALSLLFLQAQRIIFDVQKLQIRSLKRAEELAGVGSWTWDVRSDIVEWSDQLYRTFGMDPHKKVTYESYLQRVYSDDRQLTEETVQDALSDHQPYSLIHRLERPDGSLVWVHSLGEVMLDTAGKPMRLFGTTQDITERMGKEHELINSSLQP
ncbi:MAG TPA: PAS domain-containing protein [Candidatus Limnocylindria bacterium]|nr:PAS domain-containing protein [Candidatus Limnocylindria bacterium]